MNRKTQQGLLNYIRGEKELTNHSNLKRYAIPAGIATVAALVALIAGRSPPEQQQIVLKENRMTVPKVQVTGYDREHFSHLEFVTSTGESTTFYPGTAVKKWDGANYSERSRQTSELYSVLSSSGITMRLHLPQEPQRIMIGEKDYSSIVHKVGKGYRVTIPLQDIVSSSATGMVLGQKQKGVQTEGLEVLLYYKSSDSEKVSKERVPQHLEDAERYVITLLHHG